VRELAGATAVITGGGSGIGRGIAHALADEGVQIVVADIEADAAASVADELRDRGVRTLAVRSDVADAASLQALAERAYAEFRQVQILCNNAGVFMSAPLAGTSPEDWAWMIAVNLMGVVNGVRAFLPRLQAQGGESQSVNTGSISGLYPTLNQGAYAATKYAVVGYSERLRAELAADGIGVSVLCPSGVRTRLVESRRNRHEAFGGPVQSAPRAQSGGEGSQVMDPLAVGRLVVQGIRDNRLYIHTHLNVRGWIEQRFAQILTDFAPLERGGLS
jgi:NAD(P)-dependent dehydrogenase (short-subunit alcohol dehydrogenase family)